MRRRTGRFPASELKKLEDPSIKVFCLVNPANPPSVKLSDAGLDALAKLIETKRPDLFIVTDDVYGTFADDFVSLFAKCPRNTMCVYSFSKYFGATGWRLGAMALHDDNAFDDALAALPEKAKKDLDKRYSSLATKPREIRFIDRLVADSRAVALNHTAGLSTPQQLQMTLFALSGLMDLESRYKDGAKRIIRHRFATLCNNIGIKADQSENEVHYYYLIDLEKLGRRLFGDAFAKWFSAGDRGTDFLFRLAERDRGGAAAGQGIRGGRCVGSRVSRQPDRRRLCGDRKVHPKGARRVPRGVQEERQVISPLRASGMSPDLRI